jgi:hypothetical protein
VTTLRASRPQRSAGATPARRAAASRQRDTDAFVVAALSILATLVSLYDLCIFALGVGG